MMKAIVLLLAIGYACAEMPGIWLKNITVTPRIIQGENANVGEFPYMVSLERKGRGHACGGSVLTKNWVLTAAHCCVIGSQNNLYIYAGSIYLNKEGGKYDIEKLIIHENYEPNSRWRNDICLIRVSQPFDLGGKIQQITLPPQDWNVKAGDKLIVSGWGYTTPNGEQIVPNRLQKGVNFVALDNDKCGAETGTKMFSGYLCARGEHKNQGVCNGDSGSPLVKGGVQVGIASWVFLPCGSGMPDFYCRVPNYINWIIKKLDSEASQLKFI